MDDNDELDTIVMQDEDKTLDTKSDEVKEEDDQELIIIPHNRGRMYGSLEVVLSKRAGKYQMAASTCNWSFQN